MDIMCEFEYFYMQSNFNASPVWWNTYLALPQQNGRRQKKFLACCYLWFNIGKEYVKKIVVKEHASLDIVPQTISKFKYRRYAHMMTN